MEVKCAATRLCIDEQMSVKQKSPDCPLKEVWKYGKRLIIEEI